jgi:NAD+ synthase (glutamine-hydrolysing)
LPILAEVASAKPTAELRPHNQEIQQIDEEEMGMTYAELDEYGKLR